MYTLLQQDDKGTCNRVWYIITVQHANHSIVRLRDLSALTKTPSRWFDHRSDQAMSHHGRAEFLFNLFKHQLPLPEFKCRRGHENIPYEVNREELHELESGELEL